MIESPLCYIRKTRNEDGEQVDSMYSASDFSTLNSSIKCAESKSFIRDWFQDDNKRKYDCVCFTPYSRLENDTTKPYIYNLVDSRQKS